MNSLLTWSLLEFYTSKGNNSWGTTDTYGFGEWLLNSLSQGIAVVRLSTGYLMFTYLLSDSSPNRVSTQSLSACYILLTLPGIPC